MTNRLSSEQKRSTVNGLTQLAREPLKEAIKEAIEEAEAESVGSGGSGGRGSLGRLTLIGLGIGIGYWLRGQRSADGFGSLSETKARFAKTERERSEREEVDVDTGEDETEESSVEETDSGRDVLSPLLLLLGAIAAASYVLSRRSDPPEQLADEAAGSTAERTDEVAEEATSRTEDVAETLTEVTSTVTNLTKSVADRTQDAVEERAEDAVEATEELDEAAEEVTSTVTNMTKTTQDPDQIQEQTTDHDYLITEEITISQLDANSSQLDDLIREIESQKESQDKSVETNEEMKNLYRDAVWEFRKIEPQELEAYHIQTVIEGTEFVTPTVRKDTAEKLLEVTEQAPISSSLPLNISDITISWDDFRESIEDFFETRKDYFEQMEPVVEDIDEYKFDYFLVYIRNKIRQLE